MHTAFYIYQVQRMLDVSHIVFSSIEGECRTFCFNTRSIMPPLPPCVLCICSQIQVCLSQKLVPHTTAISIDWCFHMFGCVCDLRRNYMKDNVKPTWCVDGRGAFLHVAVDVECIFCKYMVYIYNICTHTYIYICIYICC